MFPGAGARIIKNEDGEPIGWDYPSDDDGKPQYCDICGYYHAGVCEDYYTEGED